MFSVELDLKEFPLDQQVLNLSLKAFWYVQHMSRVRVAAFCMCSVAIVEDDVAVCVGVDDADGTIFSYPISCELSSISIICQLRPIELRLRPCRRKGVSIKGKLTHQTEPRLIRDIVIAAMDRNLPACDFQSLKVVVDKDAENGFGCDINVSLPDGRLARKVWLPYCTTDWTTDCTLSGPLTIGLEGSEAASNPPSKEARWVSRSANFGN